MSQQYQKTDIQQEITDQIITLLDKVNLKDYEPPFAGLSSLGLPTNPVTNKTYQGINILSLWSHQQSKGYTSNQWATFKQWKNIDAKIHKGEKASRIIFYKTLIKSEENENDQTKDIKIPMLKVYNVFNANQVDGYTDSEENTKPTVNQVKPLESVDQFCRQTKALITHSGNRAFYNVNQDFINMPEKSLFQDTSFAGATENYYSTLLHELTHWTGAKHRLDRFKKDSTENNTKEEKYAFEELVAELGSAFLCAQHSITQTQPEHHAIYIKSWLKALKQNKTYIFKASAKASKAIEYLNKEKPDL